MENVFICGLSQIKEFFVTCTFTFPKKEPVSDNPSSIAIKHSIGSL